MGAADTKAQRHPLSKSEASSSTAFLRKMARLLLDWTGRRSGAISESGRRVQDMTNQAIAAALLALAAYAARKKDKETPATQPAEQAARKKPEGRA
jgi:hypothetical protein